MDRPEQTPGVAPATVAQLDQVTAKIRNMTAEAARHQDSAEPCTIIDGHACPGRNVMHELTMTPCPELAVIAALLIGERAARGRP